MHVCLSLKFSVCFLFISSTVTGSSCSRCSWLYAYVFSHLFRHSFQINKECDLVLFLTYYLSKRNLKSKDISHVQMHVQHLLQFCYFESKMVQKIKFATNFELWMLTALISWFIVITFLVRTVGGYVVIQKCFKIAPFLI